MIVGAGSPIAPCVSTRSVCPSPTTRLTMERTSLAMDWTAWSGVN
ncbi:hypothetical protein ACLI4Q_13550 [Natrialbaceae archaeon A-CW1-1]